MTQDTLTTFDPIAKRLAEAKDLLADRVNALDLRLAAIHRRRLPGIRTALKQVEDAKDALSRAIDGHRSHFAKPRSIVLHGIKLGLQKGKGKIEWEDDEVLIKRIRKHHSEQADLLIKVKETPIKSGLAELTTAELKKLGCSVEETGDTVLISLNDGPLNKLLKAILKGASTYAIEDPEPTTQNPASA